LFQIDPAGHFNEVVPIVCADDTEAIEKAKQLANGHDVELWRRDQMVATTLRAFMSFPLRLQPGLKFLKPFSVAAPEKPAVLKTDGDTPIVADFRYFPDFISQSEFAFPGERFGKEFDPITYLETIPFHLAFALSSPSCTSRWKREWKKRPQRWGTLRPKIG